MNTHYTHIHAYMHLYPTMFMRAQPYPQTHFFFGIILQDNFYYPNPRSAEIGTLQGDVAAKDSTTEMRTNWHSNSLHKGNHSCLQSPLPLDDTGK